MGSIKKSFVSTEFCGLCRRSLPVSSVYGRNAWQSEFRAVLCLDPNTNDFVEITDVAILPDVLHNIDVVLTGCPKPETVTIDRDRRVNIERPSVGPAFCFYDWCYSSLVWGVRCHPPKSIIYKLVRSLIPDPSLWENISEARHQLDLKGGLQTLLADAARFSLEPLFVSKLPNEVRAQIWEYVGLDMPYSAFILVAAESSRLARRLKSRPTYDFQLQLGCQLSVETAMVFGTTYIQGLAIDKGTKGISKVLGDVTGLKSVTGLSGICAIKVFGIDWETDWLGKVPSVSGMG